MPAFEIEGQLLEEFGGENARVTWMGHWNPGPYRLTTDPPELAQILITESEGDPRTVEFPPMFLPGPFLEMRLKAWLWLTQRVFQSSGRESRGDHEFPELETLEPQSVL